MLYVFWVWNQNRSSAYFEKKINIDLCSAISMESSRQDLLNDMAEHRPILKNN